MTLQSLRVALDWTPNINHVGLFVAREQGFYAEAGLEVGLLSPEADHYARTPGKKLELGEADVAVAPFETVISLNNKANRVPVQAIFALLQEDLSRIVTLADSGLQRPAQLDGRRYASYQARYEDHIVAELVRADGGTGQLEWLYPAKLGIWNTLLEGHADATWIFDNWEGVEADGRGVALHRFALADYGIPYGYSPVLLAKTADLDARPEAFGAFAAATRRGCLHAVQHPAAALAALQPHLTPHDARHIDLRQALAATAPHFGDAATCGQMQPERVQGFLAWLVAHGLENEAIMGQPLFRDDLLQA